MIVFLDISVYSALYSLARIRVTITGCASMRICAAVFLVTLGQHVSRTVDALVTACAAIQPPQMLPPVHVTWDGSGRQLIQSASQTAPVETATLRGTLSAPSLALLALAMTESVFAGRDLVARLAT